MNTQIWYIVLWIRYDSNLQKIKILFKILINKEPLYVFDIIIEYMSYLHLYISDRTIKEETIYIIYIHIFVWTRVSSLRRFHVARLASGWTREGEEELLRSSLFRTYLHVSRVDRARRNYTEVFRNGRRANIPSMFDVWICLHTWTLECLLILYRRNEGSIELPANVYS